MKKNRKNSFAFCGGAFGDEGKGRIVDEYVNNYLAKGPVIVYRDNGGANAGHTVALTDGTRIAMHQLPSGVFCPKATLILGKGMVIHPGDLIEEIKEVKSASGGKIARILVDKMAVLSLDTHRAFETTLKTWQEGGRGATGRGISPAYADVLLRHPLRVRDIKTFNLNKIKKHYQLYQAFHQGLGVDMAKVQVPMLGSTGLVEVGSEAIFIKKLKKQSKLLGPYIKDISSFLKDTWNNERYTFIFEKAQAIGLDYRWGVYPDVTASDTTFSGIKSATEGIIDHTNIDIRAAVIKATYMSSVGTRILPTIMEESLAKRIREDAFEYGATTRRPRGIAYLDLPALKYYTKVGDINYHVLTHMDIVYPNIPVKVCVGYTLNGINVDYRPDQEYLLKVKPIYKEFKSWDSQKIQQARDYDDIPSEAKKFLKFISHELGTKILMITTGPKRDQSIKISN